MKIVNKKKFFRMVIFIIGIILLISLILTNKSYSKGEIKQKTIYISKGDTLWEIASIEQEKNIYYQNRDIRDIILDIKKTNNLKSNTNLLVGQKLIINTL